ncbi:MAG: hypothetical protein COB41_08005 [Proteobacteria bacterium]|nr:MAG: hypothetical protein COB41_08005 [Pseudomonadota bacterium]
MVAIIVAIIPFVKQIVNIIQCNISSDNNGDTCFGTLLHNQQVTFDLIILNLRDCPIPHRK